MIRLNRRVLEQLDPQAPDVAGVCTTLQYAIELEHATIPVYLYALYSLDVARNPQIVEIIESVVFEEMLHMTLAANVLNALGGTPAIGQPGFIPEYPGPLPGGVESELTVSLRPFSMEQLALFLAIEQPENPHIYQSCSDDLDADKPITIGQFYTAISVALGQLGDAAFVRPPRHQVGPELMTNAVVVTDVASAQKALAIIIDQGEGTSTSRAAATRTTTVSCRSRSSTIWSTIRMSGRARRRIRTRACRSNSMPEASIRCHPTPAPQAIRPARSSGCCAIVSITATPHCCAHSMRSWVATTRDGRWTPPSA
jgi:hypothetical protein